MKRGEDCDANLRVMGFIIVGSTNHTFGLSLRLLVTTAENVPSVDLASVFRLDASPDATYLVWNSNLGPTVYKSHH